MGLGYTGPVVTSTVRRAAGFAFVATLALAVPTFGQVSDPAFATVAATAPFLVVAAFALTVDTRSPLFELFARHGDRRDGTLHGLAGFALAAAGLSILTVGFGMPNGVFVGTVLLVAYGNLGGQMVRAVRSEPIIATAGFVVGGAIAAAVGQMATGWATAHPPDLPMVAFISASGGLLAAWFRAVLFRRDEPLVMASVSLLLWLFASFPVDISPTRIAVALAVTVVFGYVSYALETASLPGMLTGVLLGLLTIVFGDYGWFAMLIAFFGIGGLSSKFRYEQKVARGIAEGNDGARGSGNVLANSLVALLAVLGAAASPELGLPRDLFLFTFAGSVAAALADTLSSEIGGLFDNPRLITDFEVVEPGTDGAVTWQGELAGLAGAALVAAIAVVTFQPIDLFAGIVVIAAGAAGMTVDSFLGATVEGRLLGNQGVNFFATLAAGVVGGGLALLTGLTTV